MAEEKNMPAQAEENKTENAGGVKIAPPVSKRYAKAEAPDAEESIESAINKTEGFIFDNGKLLLILLGAIVLIAAGILAYKFVYTPSQEQKAGEMMFVAEQQFAAQAYEAALNGDGNNAGFLDVIESYGSTPQGNIAKQYAGICYIKLGDLDSALAQLEKYKPAKGVPAAVVNAQNFGLRGDIYADKGEYQKAADMYRKAVEASDNEFTAPMYLKKEGMAYSKLGKTQEAIAAYKKIADIYPGSVEGRDIAKFIGAEEQK